MSKTSIEWTDATWNPIGGCSIKSPGCINCYAQRLAGTRLRTHPLYVGTTSLVKGKPVFNGQLTAAPPDAPVWSWPLRWKGAKSPKLGDGRPSLIFVGDMSDLLHEERSLGYFMRVLDTAARGRHILQVLTKRADRLAEAIRLWSDLEGEDLAEFKNARGPSAVRSAHPSGRGRLLADMLDTMGEPPASAAWPTFDWLQGPLDWPEVIPQLWLGFSAERQAEFDERWSHMKSVAALGWTVFVSIEPMLERIMLPLDFLVLGRRAQVIVGGESGPDARPMDPAWPRMLRDQCLLATVPFFFKQWGTWLIAEGVKRKPSDESFDHWRFADGDEFHIVSDGHDIVLAAAEEAKEPTKIWRGLWGDGHGHLAKKTARTSVGRRLDGHEWNEFPEFRR